MVPKIIDSYINNITNISDSIKSESDIMIKTLQDKNTLCNSAIYYKGLTDISYKCDYIINELNALKESLKRIL